MNPPENITYSGTGMHLTPKIRERRGKTEKGT